MNEDQLIEQIKEHINKNGFPTKQVALPYDKIIASLEKLNLDKELFLGRFEMFDIYTKVENNRLIFSSSPYTISANPTEMQNVLGGDTNLDDLKNMNKINLMKKVSEIMKDMSPEKMQQLKGMYENMSPEEQQEIMKKGKGLGL